jgi:thiol-disulfide isomerase/thioredoxin
LRRSGLALGAVAAIIALGTVSGLSIGIGSLVAMEEISAVTRIESAEGKQPGSSELIQVPRQPDDKKPTFALDDLSGTRLDLLHAAGRVVLVHFFATWCEPCREELPMLDRLLARSSSSFAVFAVSVGEPDDRVRRFFASMPLNYPIVLDRNREVAQAWRIQALPTTYVLDRDLEPRLMVEGEFMWDRVAPDQLLDAMQSVR